MNLIEHYRMMAAYNRQANERLYARCAMLDDAEYRKPRQGSFRSIHAILNHILLGDRLWMERFEGGGTMTPPLERILYDEFGPLRKARVAEDRRIEEFFAGVENEFLERRVDYINMAGKHYVDATTTAVAHLFNHQTHHRAQVHVMLSQTPAGPPALDLHRIVNP